VPEPKPAEPTPPPATEKTAKAEPPQKVEPEPVEKPAVVEKPEAEAMPLPTQAPSPQSRPQPRQAQTAKAPERKEAEKPAEKQQQRPKSEESKFNADDIAALLDKQKPSGGGAKRSQQEAALGGQRNDPGMKLSQSEMDALRGQIQRCWNVPAGALEAENLKVSIKFSLDRSGAISVQPQIVSGGGSAGVERAAAESARRAVLQCAPYNLPAEKYEAWADVIVNFDPSDMF
jgi:colicin import membrane protein